MGEYTEQEIEMLARFTHEMSGLSDPWESVRDERKVALLSHAREQLISTDMFSLPIRAAARLMREARKQGAAEMRERAALLAEDADVSIPMRATIAGHIRSLAVTKTEEQ